MNRKFKILSISLIFISAYSVTLAVFASPFPYTPADHQLDPACIATTPNCTVDPLSIGDIVATGTANQALYIDAAGKLANDAEFTRTPNMINLPDRSVGNIIISNVNDTADTNNIANVGVENGIFIQDNFNHHGSNMIGAVDGGFISGNGTTDQIVGVLGIAAAASGTGTITNAEAVAGNIGGIGSATITNGYLFYGQNLNATNKYGIYIDVPNSKNVLHELDLRAQSPLKWYDNDSSNFVAFQAPSTVLSDTTYTLPDGYGSNGQALTSDGIGNLSWQNPTVADGSITGVKLSTGKNYVTFTAKTNGTTPVAVFGGPSVFGGQVTSVFIIDEDGNAGNITLKNFGNIIANISKPAVIGGMKGATGINGFTLFGAGANMTVESDTLGSDATVIITATVN